MKRGKFGHSTEDTEESRREETWSEHSVERREAATSREGRGPRKLLEQALALRKP